MTTQSQSPNILAADIDDNVKKYLFWTVMWITAVTVVGIPFIPFIAIFYWAWYAPRYREYHTLELNESGVQSKRGVVFRSQTNVPVDRITDVSVHQGPLMRKFGVYNVTVESAGQTQTQGAASIIGIADPYDLRDAILQNVELYKQRSTPETTTAESTATIPQPNETQTQLLTEIRDILKRMENRES